MNFSALFCIIILCFFSMTIIACGGVKSGNTEVTTSPASASATNIIPVQGGKPDEKSILKETQAFIDRFSKDMSAGNTAAVLEQIDSGTRYQIGDSLDLTGTGAKTLAEAIAKAKPTEVNASIVFYEYTMDGETLSFYIIKEAGQWKFGGL